MHLTLAEARDLALRALAGLGYDATEAAIIAEHLVDSAARGAGAGGLQRILVIADWLKSEGGERLPIATLRESAISAALDGGGNVGFVVAHRATGIAIDKALAAGIGMVGANRTVFTGNLSFYIEMATRAGLAAIAASNAVAAVAPFGAGEAVLGTNPIAIGFPTAGDPVIWDVGAGSVSLGALMFARRLGQDLPEDVAIDAQGRPTRDPAAAIAGAIRPWGGHRGAGLAAMVQILGGILVGAEPVPRGFADWGYFVLAFKPGLLIDPDTFRERVAGFAEQVRHARPMAGATEVRMPFDGSLRARRRAEAEGFDMPDPLYAQVLALAEGRS